MGDASVVTGERSWFADADRRSRTMRVSPHPQEGVVTLSVWEGRQCTNTVRIASDELPSLIGSLAQALAVSSGPPAEDPLAYLHVAPEPAVAVEPVAPVAASPQAAAPAAAPEPPGEIEWISPPPHPVAQWMHGPVAVDGDPTDPPSQADVLVSAMARALTLVGRGARAVADHLAPRDDGPTVGPPGPPPGPPPGAPPYR